MTDPGVPPAASLFDSLRLQALLFEELRRIQTLLGERLTPPRAPEAEGDAGEHERLELLRRLQGLLLEHPLAAQAAFSALLAEGRRFATTPEGAAWKRALTSSEWVRNGRLLWDELSLNLLEEAPSGALPSSYLEAIFRVAKASDLEALLRRLRDPGGVHDIP
jgi:hypothetical protein